MISKFIKLKEEKIGKRVGTWEHRAILEGNNGTKTPQTLVLSCCATQRKKNREVQTMLQHSSISWLVQSASNRTPYSNRWNNDLVARIVLRRRKCEESDVFLW